MKNKYKKKALCILLALTMVLTLIPTVAFAAEITTGNATVTAPVGGQTPSFEAVSAEPDKYSVEFLKWIDVEANMDIYSTDGPLSRFRTVILKKSCRFPMQLCCSQ